MMIFFIFGIIIVNACSFCNEDDNEESEIVKVGQKIPPFQILMNDSTSITSNDLLGRPAVIIFFSTSCIDCRKELPIIQELYSQYGDRIYFIAISRAESQESVANYWEKEHLQIPYSAQSDRMVFSLFAKRTIPRIYVTDATGIVRNIFIEKAGIKKIAKSLEELLN